MSVRRWTAKKMTDDDHPIAVFTFGQSAHIEERLQLELRGADGGETLVIAVRDNRDSYCGVANRVVRTLSSNWQTFSFVLSRFASEDPNNLWAVLQLDFEGDNTRSVFLRNVQYLP